MATQARRKWKIRGFSMIESMLAISITTIAGGAILTSLSTSAASSNDVSRRAIARGLAAQMMGELTASHLPPKGLYTPPPTPPSNRSLFANLDDYDGWSSQPPVDRHGVAVGSNDGLGGLRTAAFQAPAYVMDDFIREVQVERVEPSLTGSGWTLVADNTDYRRVTVRVLIAGPTVVDHRMVCEISQVVTRYAPTQ